MIKALTRRCLGGADPTAPEVRQRCGTLAGGVGILLNTLLCLGKLGAGLLTGSIAVVADGLNNLSDAASSVITLIGFRLAGQAADEEHPFGHGRIEYLSGLLVAMAILLMGFELGKSSLEKLLHPEQLSFSWLAIAILAVSIGMKIWMFHFNRVLGEAISSQAMKATAADSLSDAAATAVVLAAALVDHFLDLQVDGLAGLLVAAFILKTGWEAAKDTLDPLLGRAMDPELAADIDKLVLSHPNILGIHDLVYHDYGPGRAMMSFHAEVPADTDLLEMHDIIDHIERELKAKHHIETVIHTDPVVNDERTNALREQVAMVLQKNVLFSGTILDNLRWGSENASEEECIRVAKLACADEFIERFPDKYNTWIEQGGSNVSGGQKQRLTIARALLRKPKILILDDSTSAVDTATDAKIRKAFREEIPGTTKIIIAQRISSVQDADRILVLDNGQINGLGTHEELLKNNAIYQEVYNSQTQGGGDFDKQGGEQ